MCFSNEQKGSRLLCSSTRELTFSLSLLSFSCLILMTKRNLNTRIAEHKRAVKNQELKKSALCDHLMLCDHCINWNGAGVLKYAENYYDRLTAKRWFIHAHSYVINRSDSDSSPAIYRSLVSDNQN